MTLLFSLCQWLRFCKMKGISATICCLVIVIPIFGPSCPCVGSPISSRQLRFHPPPPFAFPPDNGTWEKRGGTERSTCLHRQRRRKMAWENTMHWVGNAPLLLLLTTKSLLGSSPNILDWAMCIASKSDLVLLRLALTDDVRIEMHVSLKKSLLWLGFQCFPFSSFRPPRVDPPSGVELTGSLARWGRPPILLHYCPLVNRIF